MVKTVLGVHHQGLRDWAIQRVSAVIMLAYALVLFTFFASHHAPRFSEWHAFYATPWVKISTVLLVAATLYHAWVGMWTVFSDYLKPPVLRMVVNVSVLLFLMVLFIWSLLIVGSL